MDPLATQDPSPAGRGRLVVLRPAAQETADRPEAEALDCDHLAAGLVTEDDRYGAARQTQFFRQKLLDRLVRTALEGWGPDPEPEFVPGPAGRLVAGGPRDNLYGKTAGISHAGSLSAHLDPCQAPGLDLLCRP